MHATLDCEIDTLHRDTQLWVEYFRLELVYAQKLRARRQILGIDDSAGAQLASAQAMRRRHAVALLPA